MARKSFSNIVQSMINFLKRLHPSVDTKEGTFTRDVIIDPVANELDNFYAEADVISKAQSPDLASVDDLVKLAENLQLVRKAAVRATGTVTFYNRSGTTATIPAGTIVSSKPGAEVGAQQFVTLQTVVISDPGSFNPDRGQWEAIAPIRAQVGGSQANVDAEAINVMITAIENVSGCFNEATITTGEDQETIDSLTRRIKSVLLGNNVGTKAGYYGQVMENENVIDALVIGPGDEHSQRSSVGAVDVLIRGGVSAQAINEFTYNDGSSYHTFGYQPVHLFTTSGSFSAIGSVTGNLVEGTDYTVVKDTGFYGGSVRGNDKFYFFPTLTDGETITIIYTYNSLIPTLQAAIDGDSAKIVCADVLIKEAKVRWIDVTATIELFAGYDITEVITNVETAIANALSGYLIGQEVQQSDIIAVIAAIEGVDDVLVPLTKFEENSATGDITQDSDGNLEIPWDSYATSGTITVIVKS
ncbi:MAG: baseplate J/gp47 family protein [Candidatus Cloacimonetes bacterium]|nr:baseplate J/gp47 family protein [Candidatus Cloacimonadota bacterium]